VTPLLRRIAGSAAAGAIVLLSAWASGWPRSSLIAEVGTLASAVAVLAAGAACRRARTAAAPATSAQPAEPAPGGAAGAGERIGAALWLAVALVAVAWDLLALVTPPHRPHLTLSATTLGYRPFHALAFACWLGLGLVLAAAPVRQSGSGRHRRRRLPA
jgi:hypothetical protein